MKRQEESNETEQMETNLFDYLQSSQGHEIAQNVIKIINEIKKVTIDKNADFFTKDAEYAHIQKISFMKLQGAVFIVTIIAACFLSYVGKLDSTTGFLFGSLVGYFFGKDRIFILGKKQDQNK